MSTLAERKCALFLTTLRWGDRRRLLSGLPLETAKRVRGLLRELEALPFAVAEVAAEVLAEDVRGLTSSTSLDLDQMLALADRLSPAWCARVIAVWPNIDRNFCLSMLETRTAGAVRRELAALPALPTKLADALRAEAVLLAGSGRA